MRRATLLAVALVLAVGGTVQATPRFATVAGSYAYELFGSTRTVQLEARAGDPAAGSFSYVSPFGSMSGPVTCVRVIGLDAWVAGAVTAGSVLPDVVGWVVRVRDGGTAGANRDMAVTYVDTLQGVLDFCQGRNTPGRSGTWCPSRPATSWSVPLHKAGDRIASAARRSADRPGLLRPERREASGAIRRPLAQDVGAAR